MQISNMEVAHLNHAIPLRIYAPEGATRQVVIGVHGFAGSMDSPVLYALAERLTRENKTLVCFDFPAHGLSRAGEELLQVEVCRQDLLCVADFVRRNYPQIPHGIFATSFGGYIAVLCQDELKDFPFVLRGPALAMADIFRTSILPCPLDEFLKHGGAWCSLEFKFYVSARFYQDLLDHPCPLPNRPMLMIQGAEDQLVPPAAAMELTKAVPFVELRLIKGANHRFIGHVDELIDSAVRWLSIWANDAAAPQ